ncbi:WxL domain-containing protein [Enterococcus casseliflavus]|uniref:WxL domain-containing protein n=1 Tax=Enterococcus casseliflavus TaxID=37734 RepID=UPI00188375C3|nr:WxL domain-containing protein [Enterococcus casseliflavus]MBE9909345.1 WxL domain-containing protein [Enterococcus casseliflavus]
MKKKILTIAAATLLGSLFMSNQLIAQAVSYDSSTKATTEGTVTIVEDDNPEIVVPDPEAPDNPLDPENPINPNPGQLRINYISDFSFGSIKNTSSAVTLSAQLDKLWAEDGSEVGRVPFVTTEDLRGTSRQGWELRVSQPEQFKDADGNELQGASLSIGGLRYASESTAAPTVNPNTIVLNESEQAVATASSTQGVGLWSLALGKANDDGGTDGVTLDIPANTVKNNTDYTSSIVWELVADPSATN